MCVTPCQTCADVYFYSCQSCSDASLTLTGSLCLGTPTIYYQIVTTCLVFIYIIPVLIRKRCLTMVKIVDFIQIAAYFKLIKGYTPIRHIWLYLGMRSWGNWAEGWSLISADITPPIWTVQQGVINKSIRIGATWGFFILTAVILGALKVALDEKQMTFQKFMRKNLGNYMSYAFYFTLQDISFVIAIPILNPNFSSTFGIICFAIAIFLALLCVVLITWSFCVINFQDSEQKYYHYKYFFLFSADYDLFPTYDLLELPKKAKQIKRYSNIRIIDMVKKIAYAFLIVSYISSKSYSNSTTQDQLFQILGFLVFFEIIWLLILPYNIRRQFIQFIIGLLAFGVTVYLLFGPFYLQQQLINTIIVLVLFGLALISLIVELFFNIYRIVPVDLYGIGLKVVIEDHRLLKQIAMRRKQQQQIQRKLKQMQEQNERLKRQMEQKQNQKKVITSQQKLPPPAKQMTQGQSEMSLAGDKEVLKTKGQLLNNNLSHNKVINDEEFQERQSMNSQQLADLFKVDELKRRKVYQWNKQQPFNFSNKMQ